jgi:hypothetical protein
VVAEVPAQDVSLGARLIARTFPDLTLSIQSWLKGTLSLVRTADDHEKRGDSEQAFILLARAATWVPIRCPAGAGQLLLTTFSPELYLNVFRRILTLRSRFHRLRKPTYGM